MCLPEGNEYTIENYNNLSADVPCELIDGQFYRQAAKSQKHQRILHELYSAIQYYINTKNKSCQVFHAPFPVRLNKDDRTLIKPDIFVVSDTSIMKDQMCDGCPDWVVEIVSPSTSSHDYILKLNIYRRAGVREYWIINARLKTVLVYYFDIKEHTTQYTFKEKIPVHIFNNLLIDTAWFEI